jgi:hypothetical protein
MPELDFGLAKAPTEQHMSTAGLAREIDQAESRIFELDAEGLELALVPVELTRQVERASLELFAAIVRFVGTRGRGDEIELEDRLAPATMLLYDVLDDLPNQWKRAVRLIDREELHTRKVQGCVRRLIEKND